VSCRFAHDDAAYLLGALSPAEREEYEQHLSTCAECAESVRRLAGLPGLLSRVPVEVLDPPADEPVPDTLLPGLVREVRRTQRRRRYLSVGAAAAAAAAIVGAASVLGTSVLPGHDAAPPGNGATSVSAPPATQVMTALHQGSVRARVGFAQAAWGTQLSVTCTYVPSASAYGSPSAAAYFLVVRTRDGRSEQVASWRAVPGTMHILAATAAAAPNISAVEVRTASGQPVLRWTS